MRIVHVIPSVAPRLGGPSRAVEELCTALSQRGHDVDLVTTALDGRGSWHPGIRASEVMDVPIDQTLERDGYRITYCRPLWPGFWARSRSMIGFLRKLIPRADVVHIHSLYLFPTLLASRLARRAGVPYVVRPHGTLDPYHRQRHRLRKFIYTTLFEWRTLRDAAAIHFTSEEERILSAPAIPSSVKQYVIPHGVDVESLGSLPNRADVRRSRGIADDAFVWLFLGRLNYKKGLDLLGPAFVRFSGQVPNARLIVAGPDDEGLGSRLLDVCKRGGVADRVQLTGLLDKAKMKEALAIADAWVLPSHAENFGLAVVEAMASGLPVLITDRVNISPSIRAAGAGVVVPLGLDALVDGMLEVSRLTAPERRVMGAQGRKLCIEDYGWDRIAQRVSAMYSRLVERSGRRSQRVAQ
jgi:glycosyltransferase involved in cell wall biosynthesis